MKIALIYSKDKTHIRDPYIYIKSFLSEHNIDCDICTWNNENVNWEIYNMLFIREVYDYIEHIEDFVNWINHISSLNVKIYNTKEIILKNSNKTYMKGMNNIIPTLFISKYTKKHEIIKVINNEYLEKYNNFIIKPSISSDSRGCFKIDKDNIVSIILETLEKYDNDIELMIQPFFENISNGEISLILFDMEYSHSILKKPKNGEYRVQELYGGFTKKFEPSKNLIDLSKNFIYDFINKNNIKVPPFICRVDVLEYENKYYLMELEMIEPDLYFDEETIDIFCNTIIKKINNNYLNCLK